MSGKDRYYREQKHICGARYMEVDLYPVSLQQHRSSTRKKKEEASTLAMQEYNSSRALRYHVQLVNTNFCERDFVFTATYRDEMLPAPGDTRRADKDWANYIKRLYRFCDRKRIQRPKWIMATEYSTIDEDGSTIGRHHHHAIIQHTEGLTRELLEEIWGMGFCRCEKLDLDHESAEGLVRYISKNKRCARKWRQSQGLEKPITPRPNDTKWSRRKLEEASTLHIDDRDFWESQYPGYTMNRVETKVNCFGERHTLVILSAKGERNDNPNTEKLSRNAPGKAATRGNAGKNRKRTIRRS